MCLEKDIVAILRPAKSQQFARTALLIFANCMTLEVVTNVLMTSSLRHLSCMNMFKERLDLYAEDSFRVMLRTSNILQRRIAAVANGPVAYNRHGEYAAIKFQDTISWLYRARSK